MKTIKTSARILAVSILLPTVLAACGTKDTDPSEKVDAPGYYNGPMKTKGSGGDKGADK